MIDISIITKSPNKTIKYINKLNINIYKITYKKDSITLTVNKKDIEKIDKFYHYKITKIYGLSNLKKYIKNNTLYIIYLVATIFLIIAFTQITIKVDVITENTQLRNYLLNELSKEKIEKYKLIKSNEELSIIKEKLLNNNKDKLEWLNIERQGMTYTINLEPKVDKNKIEEKIYCNVISKKDAIITKIITHKGVELVEPNDSVKKDTILISGDIMYNDETKKQVCANGEVYGTTWYEINISIPTTKEKIIKKEAKRYNILYKYNNKTKKLLKNKYKDFITYKKRIVNLFGLEIYIQKEIPVKRENIKYTEKELEKLVEEKINESLSHQLKGSYSIKHQNVLKKHTNNSKIELEIFIVTEELISAIESKE